MWENSFTIANKHRDILPNHWPCIDIASEKGVYSWLVLPVAEHGFCLHKGAFHDAICLRCEWHPPALLSTCICGHNFSSDHALYCHMGDFQHLAIMTSLLLTEICNDISTESPLQPLSGESLQYETANSDNSACLDMKVRGFWWVHQQVAFFDVRVSNALWSISP